MPAPKRKPPARRKRTSDPNLEPGLAAATRRSQRTRKTTPKIDPLPRKKFGGLSPKKKAPAPRSPGLRPPKPPTRRRKPAPASPRQLLPLPRRRPGAPAPTRRRVNPRTMELLPPTPRRKPATPKKRAPARPRAAAPKRAKPAAPKKRLK